MQLLISTTVEFADASVKTIKKQEIIRETAFVLREQFPIQLNLVDKISIFIVQISL